MKKKEQCFKLIIFSGILGVIIFNSFCKQESYGERFKGINEAISLDVDAQEIEDSIGISFNIIKTKDIGYEPMNKFFWINVEKKLEKAEIKILAQEIIQAVIENKPNTYHSFTVHFICRDKSEELEENPESFAKVTFLPKGSWAKVGRVPINDYKGYKLICTIEN